jgi:hypothetical protein
VTARRRTAAGLILAAACLLTACSGAATGTHHRPARPFPWWASVQPPGAVQAGVFRGKPGSAADTCVRVGDHREVRSGGFLAGPFAADRQFFAAAYQQRGQRTEVKLYWVPLHVGHMTGLAVQATLLGGSQLTRAIDQRQVAAGGNFVFYPSAVPIPAPGTWQLTGRAGADRGCFIVTFR